MEPDAVFNREAAEEWLEARDRWLALEDTARNWSLRPSPQPAFVRDDTLTLGEIHRELQGLRRFMGVDTADPCPVCSGQRREADGTFTVRKPILAYAREVLRDLIVDYNEGRITPDTMRDCLAVLEIEMAEVATTTKGTP